MVQDTDADPRGSGFTLIETVIGLVILTFVTLVLYSLSMEMTKSVLVQDSKFIIRDEARLAMQDIVRHLRMSARSTFLTADEDGTLVALGAEPVTNIVFRMAQDGPETDEDGNALTPNGVAVTREMTLGLSQPITYMLDLNDLNGNGKTTAELVQVDGNGGLVRVLSSNLSPVAVGPDGGFYEAPLGGVTFQDVGGAIQVTLILRRKAALSGTVLALRLDEIVAPKN